VTAAAVMGCSHPEGCLDVGPAAAVLRVEKLAGQAYC
jgi:hypothetical protein